MPADDLNYKVALNAGAKRLAAGELRKAEEQFRHAIKRCSECAGGYRGLAKVFVDQEDGVAALETLRDGAQTLARLGNRAEAIELLRDAVRLSLVDLAVHRRLAAALANAGDEEGAVDEYARFVGLLADRGDVDRARLELAYGRATLGESPGLVELSRRLGVPPPVAPSPVAAAAPARPPVAETAPAPARPAEPLNAREQALWLDEHAQSLLAQGSERAVPVALEAARALLETGLRTAATDLLLQVVSRGLPDREAQRLLVDVLRGLGRADLARDKCLLLARALRLDGREDLAVEMERLGAA